MLNERFEEQVKRTPNKLAVKTDRGMVTYSELNEYACVIAALIESHWSENLKYENVALYIEHGVDMIAAILGTLKAGKAYVPISPAYPAKRTAYILSHSEAALVLTNSNCEKNAGKMAKEANIPVLNIDKRQGLRIIPEKISCKKVDEYRPAYIMYTSGSTGKPKGVMQTHRNVIYYIENWTRFFSIGESDRMTLFSSFCHDGSVQDMFGALLNGATLYPFDVRSRDTASSLSRFIIDEKITIWHSVPSLYNFFVTTLTGEECFDDLRYILLGGEAFRGYEIEMFKKYFPRSILADVYGQTESSVNSIWTIHADDPVEHLIIGEPLNNTRIFVVDDGGNEMSPFEIGEILVACPHISPGYWKNEEASQQSFSEEAELGRLYWTGDLGRLLPDGNIEFMGRKDFQVKIRGFRVEVGEIETSLLQRKDIREAVVIAKKNEPYSVRLCAFITAERLLNVEELRDYLSGELPDYMIPSSFVQLDSLPLTQSGKIDRKALAMVEEESMRLKAEYVPPQSEMEKMVASIWREVLNTDSIGVQENLFDLGGNSFDIIKISNKLKTRLNWEIPIVKLFEYPTVATLSNYLRRYHGGEEQYISNPGSVTSDHPVRDVNENPLDIAVIGMAGRFPGAENIDLFWENLKNGVESITYFSDEELSVSGIAGDLLNNPDFVKIKGKLENIDRFDAAFFGYTPMEAEIMDPQLRILHECTWEALEHAGYNPFRYEGLIGLYAGNAPNHYWVAQTFFNQNENSLSQFETGLLTNHFSTRVSYKLNLTGPSIVVRTACSTSLVAVHMACRGLLNNECKLAVAGGVSIAFPNSPGYLYREGLIFSRDGHCRAFDAQASGTVFGDGVGLVVLKRLKDALTAGDFIHAIIKGSAINNDGIRKVGYTAPSVEGQTEVIGAALKEAGVEPESISFIETHGTGTILGDPVEVEALKPLFRKNKKGSCAVGAVKNNIGHLNAAAGAAGFIKIVLSLRHRLLPPTINFEIPNPAINLIDGPFYINSRLSQWENGRYPLRAGVSSFGFGGTNAHVVLEESPTCSGRKDIPVTTEEQEDVLILLSAKSQTALEKTAENLANYLKNNSGTKLPDVAFTLQVGREPFKYRKMVVCSNSNIDEVAKLLLLPDPGNINTYSPKEGQRSVIFVFPGREDGDGVDVQLVKIGLALYKKYSVFRREMDRCLDILESLVGQNMRDASGIPLYPLIKPNPEMAINSGEITRSMLFAQEYALVKLLTWWGIQPIAMIGSGFGEYTAACLSGVFSLEEALELLVSKDQKETVDRVSFKNPKIPYISGKTGKWVSPEEVKDPQFWTGYFTKPSRFPEGIALLQKIENSTLLLFGPCISLITSPGVLQGEKNIPLVIPLNRDSKEDVTDVHFLLNQIGRLWLYGVNIDWDNFYLGEKRYRIPLPTYPFERCRYWLEIDPFKSGAAVLAKAESVKNQDLSRWFYVPTWIRSVSEPRGTEQSIPQSRWLIFSDKNGLGTALAALLEGNGHDVVVVNPGPEFLHESIASYIVSSQNKGDYDSLMGHLQSEDKIPNSIIYLWSMNPIATNVGVPGIEQSDNILLPGFSNLLYIVHAIENRGINSPLQIHVVGSNMADVTGNDPISPGRATLIALARSISLEYPHIDCRCIDISFADERGGNENPKLLMEEFNRAPGARSIAFRWNHRWEQIFHPIRLERKKERIPSLVNGGIYVITGEITELSLILAENLIRSLNAKLILVCRSDFPRREDWRGILETHGENSDITSQILRIKEIEKNSKELSIYPRAFSSQAVLGETFRQIEKTFGPINGVIHSEGKPPDNTIQFQIQKMIEEHLIKKINDFLVLDRLVSGKKLDFFIVSSSIVSILPRKGQVLYGMLNGFFDAFAADCYRKRENPLISVNWSDGWTRSTSTAEGIHPDEVFEVFRRIINNPYPRVVVMEQDFITMLDNAESCRWVVKPREIEADSSPGAGGAHRRPDLETPYTPPGNEIEKELEYLWRQFFGFDRVGIHDDFFELGGDSLNVMTVISRIREKLEILVPIPEFFDNPTIEGVAGYVSSCSRSSIPVPLEPVEKKEFYPLSPAQKRLYILLQIEKDNLSYNLTRAVRWEGKLEKSRLEDTFDKLIQRHESLRTSFELIEKFPVQKIHSTVGFGIDYFDMGKVAGGYTDDRREDEIKRIIKTFVRSFDLSRVPLFRVGLINVDDEVHILMTDMHHIISDGISIGLLINDFVQLYAGNQLEPLDIQYKEFSEWLNSDREREALKKQRNYWCKEFEGDIPELCLPTDFDRPMVQGFEGDSIRFEITRDETEALKKIGRDREATLFMVLLAVYNVLLMKMTGLEDIVVGTGIAGRRQADLQDVIGMFVNTLALRNYPRKEKTFKIFLKEVREKILQAYENQDYPFEELVEEFVPVRNWSRNPLFDTVLVSQNMNMQTGVTDVSPVGSPGWTVTPFSYKNKISRFDISWFYVEVEDKLLFSVEYSTKLFKEETILQFIGYFKDVVAGLVKNSGVKLKDINLSHSILRVQPGNFSMELEF